MLVILFYGSCARGLNISNVSLSALKFKVSLLHLTTLPISIEARNLTHGSTSMMLPIKWPWAPDDVSARNRRIGVKYSLPLQTHDTPKGNFKQKRRLINL